MKLVVASGKGGTGKTTVATSLALSLSREPQKSHRVQFLDCDVEAPNAHLYLNPVIDRHLEAVIHIPKINHDLCTGCGKCAEVCQFHALAIIRNKVILFPQLCHGCGSCTSNCPEGVLTEMPRSIGRMEAGAVDGNMQFARGTLTISEPMPTPIIRQLKRWALIHTETIAILDAPPGASCPVVAALRGSDFALLVTEPSPFGLHDLKQVVEIVRELKIPCGVLINRDGIGNRDVETFCEIEKLPVLMRIPFDRTIAAGISAGKTLIEIEPAYEKAFQNVYEDICAIIAGRQLCQP
jgi:MinD superfamily P-loop ATPase